MFIRAYLRASTNDQDASRARDALKEFVAQQNARIAAFYIENVSGAKLDRPELLRLLNDSEPGDVLLVEAVDRLTRLDKGTWDALHHRIERAGLQIVACDLPLTYTMLRPVIAEDGIQEWMTQALSRMFLEFMAAFARKDYETRRSRQLQGINKAREAGMYQGRPPNLELRKKISDCLEKGFSVRGTAKVLSCSTSTVIKQKSFLNSKLSSDKDV